jgi:hypothetical protein
LACCLPIREDAFESKQYKQYYMLQTAVGEYSRAKRLPL